jgi:flagellar motor switch protein FliM
MPKTIVAQQPPFQGKAPNDTGLQLSSGPVQTQIWEQYGDLQCTLALNVPVPGFRVRDLLSLGPQTVIDTGWPQAQEVPLRLNGELILTANFEVHGDRLAVRVVEVV